MRFIGIDIGTTSICSVVIDTKRSRVLAAITKQNNSWIKTKNTWEKIQDPDVILKISTALICELKDKYKNIQAIGISNQMHGILYVNKEGQKVSPLFTWQDTRAGLVFSKNKSYAQHLSEVTGYILSPGFGIATHYYNLKNKIVPNNAAFFCTIGDYVAMKLAGNKKPVMDYSNAASLGLFDLKKMCFDQKAVKKAGIKKELLPKLSSSGKFLGKMSDGAEVYSAIGDNQASILGSIKNVRDSILVNMGTGGQISFYSQQFIKCEGLDIRPFPGKGYVCVGASVCGGKSYALLKNFFEKTLKLCGVEVPAEDVLFRKMNNMDYCSTKKQENITVKTQFVGTRIDPEKRGSISGISLENFTPECLTVAFLEGMVQELYEFYLKIPQFLRKKARKIVGSGNGVRNNVLLCKIISNTFGLRVFIPQGKEEAAIGAAFCAATGKKAFKDFFSCGKMINYQKK